MSCNNCNPCNDCPPQVSYTLPPCVGGEPCEELSQVDCVSFVGPNLPALGVTNNDRLVTILTKLHKVLNGVITPAVPIATYTATNTGTGANIPPLVVTYLGLGPVVKTGGTGSGTTITVGSTSGLQVGMTVEVTSGTGAFAANTTITAIPSATTFTVSAAPTTALVSGAIVTATGKEHQIFTINVLPNAPQTFKAFAASPVKLSGTGTIL